MKTGKPIALLASLLALPLIHALGGENPSPWAPHSPGTLSCVQEKDANLGQDVTRITFKPNQQNRDPYWCSAVMDFPAPKKANTITLKIRSAPECRVMFKVVDAKGNDAFYEFPAYEAWAQVTLRTDRPDRTSRGALGEIKFMQFDFFNPHYKVGDRVSLWVADATVTDIQPAPPKPYHERNWMPAKIPPPVDGYRIETCIWNVWDNDGWGHGDADFNGFDRPQGNAVARDVLDHLVKDYKYVGVDMPYVSGEWGKGLCELLTSLGGLPMSEGHHNPSRDFLVKNNALSRNIHGQNVWQAGWNDGTLAQDMTHPAVLQFMRDRFVASANAGAKAWRSVDYVWPWWGGGWSWGYSESAIERWRENLTETDVGVEIVDGAKTRVVHFMEYFRSYHGYTPTPQDAGLTRWDEYHPPKNGEPGSQALNNKRKLQAMLFHYEWLKFINEVSRPAAKLGLMAQPICNPEFHDNGTDLYWLMKCAFVRGFAAEWWGGAGVIVPNYYNGRYYDNVARKNGKEIVNLGESAAAGGSPFWGKLGRPHYWDNQANYLITYAQSASLDFKAKHDQYWGSSWKRMSDPNGREYQSFTAFRSAWAGFLQCRNDKAWKPGADVLAIQQRPVSRNVDAFDVGWGNQPYNIARFLVGLQYLYDGAAFPMDDSFVLDEYKTILYTPFEPPAGFVQTMGTWVAAKPGRTLITHSFVPTRGSSATDLPRSDALQPGGHEKALGFDGIAQGTQREGILKTGVPAFAQALSAYIGKNIRLAVPLYTTAGGTPLATLGDQPLVSERVVGKGKVIYLHFRPEENRPNPRTEIVDPLVQSAKFEQAVLDGVMRYTGQKPAARAPEGVHVLRFECPDQRMAVVTLNTAAQTQMKYGDNVFNTYQARDPEYRGAAQVLVSQPARKYTITDMLTGESTAATSDRDGYLPLDLSGWNMRGVYIAPTP